MVRTNQSDRLFNRAESVKSLDVIEECFVTGTGILTDRGYIPVEELHIGDRLKVADGSLQDIKWLGYQTRHPHQIDNPLLGYPILIKTGALGENLPHQDLLVSPNHGLLVDGLLIEAGALVNETSIMKTTPSKTFVYYHVELANHNLLLAEGVLVESYSPQKVDHLSFDNGAEYGQLYPDGNSDLILWSLNYPRIKSKVKVPIYVKEKLNQLSNTINQ